MLFKSTTRTGLQVFAEFHWLGIYEHCDIQALIELAGVRTRNAESARRSTQATRHMSSPVSNHLPSLALRTFSFFCRLSFFACLRSALDSPRPCRWSLSVRALSSSFDFFFFFFFGSSSRMKSSDGLISFVTSSSSSSSSISSSESSASALDCAVKGTALETSSDWGVESCAALEAAFFASCAALIAARARSLASRSARSRSNLSLPAY